MDTSNLLTDRLSEQIEQLLSLLDSARAHSRQLEQELLEAREERDAVRGRLQAARERVDALLERLPELQNALEGER